MLNKQWNLKNGRKYGVKLILTWDVKLEQTIITWRNKTYLLESITQRAPVTFIHRQHVDEDHHLVPVVVFKKFDDSWSDSCVSAPGTWEGGILLLIAYTGIRTILQLNITWVIYEKCCQIKGRFDQYGNGKKNHIIEHQPTIVFALPKASLLISSRVSSCSTFCNNPGWSELRSEMGQHYR